MLLIRNDLAVSRVVQAVSIVFFTDDWRPDSFYDRILANTQQGLHTLCLLDIKVGDLTGQTNSC